MMGTITPAAITLLNKLVSNAIRRDHQPDKIINLFTALADYQREQEITPYWDHIHNGSGWDAVHN